MNYSSRVLGEHLAHQLEARASAAILFVGSDTFDRADLASVSCFNFIAAQRLSAVLHDLGIRNTRDVFERLPPSSLAVPGIGAVSIAVLGACFEAKGIGGAAPLEAWVSKHRRTPTDREFLTFDTIKHRARKREDEAAANAKKKRRARR